MDPDAHRIYVSRGTHMMVVDEISGKVIGDIPDTKGIHGIALAYRSGQGIYEQWRVQLRHRRRSENAESLDRKSRSTGDNPDSIIYDPMTKRVFTFNGKTNNSTVIDATTERSSARWRWAASPRNPRSTARATSS